MNKCEENNRSFIFHIPNRISFKKFFMIKTNAAMELAKLMVDYYCIKNKELTPEFRSDHIFQYEYFVIYNFHNKYL